MDLFKQFPQQAFSAGNDTGAQLDPKILPVDMDGGAVYVRALFFRLSGTFTSTGGGNGNLSRLINRVQVSIPGMGDVVNISGNRLARLYRAENKGNYPPFVNPTTSAKAWGGVSSLAAGANDIDMTWVLEFARPQARRYDDGSLPAKLLRAASTFKVTFGQLTDVIADGTAASLTLTVDAILCRKRETRLPQMTVIDTIDLVGTQPVISPADGRILTAIISPTADGVFPAATDYTVLGLKFGDSLVFSERGLTVSKYYAAFNKAATTTDEDHTASRADRTSFLPLQFPPDGHQGQHVSFEAVPSGYTPELVTDVAANDYTLTRRYALDKRGTAMRAAAAILGKKFKGSMPASHKPCADPEVNAFIPEKLGS